MSWPAVACRQGFESKAQTLEAEHILVSGQVERTKVNIEAKQRAEDDIRRDVEIAKLGAENALVERVGAMTSIHHFWKVSAVKTLSPMPHSVHMYSFAHDTSTHGNTFHVVTSMELPLGCLFACRSAE